ncbi:MAG: DUF6452 family protein [Lutibacter sp.]|jgi:hypothetical protein|uniref:DUF6452 family protein n=1 Tax=Lutibacter sp. TaxID=1925666 RepID=UPI00299D5283|nr:DUF6452 family protein [Lutibacter sp.]MDX1828266.1 DUF6452 family protein [Lutibacter sp.]
MKKQIIIFIILITAFLSCEKDDICIDAITPNLIIRFYNDTLQTELKKVELDSVWAINKNGLSAYKGVSTDSIAIPLDLTENTTKYIIENNSVKDTIEFSYSRNDVFVSRSCGYKTIFDNLQISNNTNNWIKSITINNTTISDEKAAHINIYH